MQRHLHYMRNVRPFDAVVGASGAQIVEKVVSSIIGAMRRSTATLSVLFAIAAFLLSAACGGDDGMHRYLETADAAFEEVRLSQVKVQGAFGALPRITDPQFFTALATASEDGAGVADDALTDWRKIKPADDSKAFHKRVEDDLDRVKSLYKAISESTASKSYEKVFSAYADLPALLAELNSANRQWIDFGKKAKFDVAKAEAATSKETPEAAAKREYLFQVLPYLGTTLDVEGKLATGFGAFDATFSDRLTASVAPLNQSMTRARSGVTSIKPPAGAEQVHREVSAAIEAVQLLTSGLEDAGRQKTMRAFAEAYRPLGTLLTTSDLDCSWRQLVAATGITGPTGACTPPSPAKKADVEYAFGAFVVMGGLADSFTNLTPKSPKTAAEFAEYSTSLARAAMTAQRDAAVLRPVASSAPYHDALTGYLADLQRESEALAQAFRTPNASRAQASAAAIQELLTVRTREVGALFDAMYKASIRR